MYLCTKYLIISAFIFRIISHFKNLIIVVS